MIITPSKKQLDFFNSTEPNLIAVGPPGVGKKTACREKFEQNIITGAKNNPNYKCLIVSNKQKDLSIILRDYFQENINLKKNKSFTFRGAQIDLKYQKEIYCKINYDLYQGVWFCNYAPYGYFYDDIPNYEPTNNQFLLKRIPWSIHTIQKSSIFDKKRYKDFMNFYLQGVRPNDQGIINGHSIYDPNRINKDWRSFLFTPNNCGFWSEQRIQDAKQMFKNNYDKYYGEDFTP